MAMNGLIILTISCVVVQSFNTDILNPDNVYSSLAFVFDTTGSMQDDYQQLKSHAEDIMTYVQNRNDTNIKHFVFVPFSDPGVGPVTETFNPSVVMKKLSQSLITGGGDCPEMAITAVIEALKAAKPNSYIYVFTDASPKDSHLVYEALELIQRKQSQVVVLKTGDCSSSDQSYERIASLGSGHVFDVNKGDISKILEFVKTSLDTNRVNLISLNIQKSEMNPTPIKLNVDQSLKSLLVSVSGLNPNIDLINPRGRIMDESQGLMTDLDLKNVKIVSVMEPLPGEWTLNVTSESSHTIRACGVSNKIFNFGFSTTRPKNMIQTSHRPLKGTKNYVLVECPYITTFLSCNIQDISSDGKTEVLPIQNMRNNMLLCGPFLPHNDPFYIQIFGKNNEGNYIKRISKTSIIPDEPDMPYITTPKKVIGVVGSELRINCRVESLVPFTVTWKEPRNIQHSWTFNESSEIELSVLNITAHQIGSYTCSARNIAGSSESTTTVTVISKPSIDGGNDNVTIVLYEGEDYSITCLGQGQPKPEMLWLMNNVPIFHYDEHLFITKEDLRLIIYDATLSNTNVYTCRAFNEAGMTEKHYHIIVQIKMDSTEANESLVMSEFSDVYLRCPLKNAIHQWFKDGININNIIYKRADEQHFKQISDGLKIYELDKGDKAIYKCKTINESYSIDLQVAFYPSFITLHQPDTITVKKNESVLFDCMVNGYPTPKVFWRKDESILPITQWTLKGAELLENKQKLKIEHTNSIHNGTYSCTVSNKLGSDSRRFELLVL